MEQQQQSSNGQWRIKNVLTPILWIIALLVSLLVATLAAGTNEAFTWVFAALLVLVVLFALVQYQYFAIKDPNKLQSEDFRIQQDTLSLVHGRGIEPRLPNQENTQNPHIIEVDSVGKSQ